MLPMLKMSTEKPSTRCWFSLSLVFSLTLLGCSNKETDSAAHSTAFCAVPRPASALTALDRYVSTLDTNYSFHLVRTIPGKDQTTFPLEMTSQAWLTTKEVDRPLWKHWLILVRPDKVASSKSLLFISGGANDG